MPDARTLAGLLLVLSPVLGLIPVAYPPLLSIWYAPREEHVATVAAHRRAWRMLNAGFAAATLGTGGGLLVLAVALQPDDGWAALAGALASTYLVAGTLWCAILAIRSLTTPALLDLGLTAAPPTSGEALLGAAFGGLFAAFVLATGVSLLGVSAVVALAGSVAIPIAVVAAIVTAIVIGSQLVTGDAIPAVLYLPTLLIGVALLAGWR